MKNLTLLTAAVIVALTLSTTGCCKKKCKEPDEKTVNTSSHALADTIIYNVIIKNPDINDEWTSSCLKNLDRKMLVEHVSKAVFTGKLTAIDFFSDSIISSLKLEELQSKFNIDKIGQVQFEETWEYDSINYIMTKKVRSMVFGEEFLNNNNEVIGYKPIFKVILPD